MDAWFILWLNNVDVVLRCQYIDDFVWRWLYFRFLIIDWIAMLYCIIFCVHSLLIMWMMWLIVFPVHDIMEYPVLLCIHLRPYMLYFIDATYYYWCVNDTVIIDIHWTRIVALCSDDRYWWLILETIEHARIWWTSIELSIDIYIGVL